MIVFSCSSCGLPLQAAVDHAGNKGHCPDCAAPFEVPAAAMSVSEPTVPRTNPAPLPTVAYVPSAESATQAIDSAPTERLSNIPVAIPGYEVVGELGRGGMGVIYRARQLSPRRLVALKMILAGEHAGAEARTRFTREAEAAARLAHPNIVPIHEVGEHNGHPYLTLELVEGGNLAQKLSAETLPFRQAVELMHQLAQAVGFAHGRGIIHRDLKPANVLLTIDGVPKITDFGLAKQVDGMTSVAATGPRTQSGAILGTPSYMAPEQAGGKSETIGPPADVYALGAILYECLTGRPPFQAETMIDTLLKVASEEPTPPRKLRPECPRDLETICLKCLQKDPARRYASAGALAGNLRRWLDGEPIASRPPGKWERLVRSLKRRKELVYLAAGVLATLCVSLLVVLLRPQPKEETAPRSTAAGAATAMEWPEDLRLVPDDAEGFISLRVADLWKQKTIKQLLGADWFERANPLGPGEVEKLTALQRDSGIGPADLARVTFVALDNADPQSGAVLLFLAKPCDQKRVLQALTKQQPPINSRRVGDKVIHRVEGQEFASFCFFSDRLLLFGSQKSLTHLLQQKSDGRDRGVLHDALKRAAEPHLLVACLRPSESILQALDSLEPKARIESLRDMETASLTLDLPASAQGDKPLTGLSIDVCLTFSNETTARPGREVVQALLRHLLASLKPDKVPIEFRPLAALLEPLHSADWRLEGSRVRLAVQFRWKPRIVEDLQNALVLRARSALIENQLKQIGLAMHRYHDTHKHFPPAVIHGKDNKPLYSWRVLLLPHLGEQKLFDQFHLDEPWDGEHNKKLLAKMPAVFAAPSDKPEKSNDRTFYQAIVGPGAAFEGRAGLRMVDFTDGTANTLLVVEAAEAVPWTSPRDLVYQPGRPLPKLGRQIPGLFHAAFVDGHARSLKTNLPEKALLTLITRNAGDVIPVEIDQ